MTLLLASVLLASLAACSSFSTTRRGHGGRLVMTLSQPKNMREQIFNQINVCAAGSFIGAMLVLPSLSRAKTDAGIGDIQISYDGVSKPISEYLGKKATLIINVASQCALTPQYEELVALYDKYNKYGFTILGFPCNQFGSQEPAPVERIRKDMKAAFGVEFPLFDKIDVNGANVHPLYQKLKSYDNIGVSNIQKISWNFEKFLIDGNGVPVRRYKPGILPSSLENDVAELIKTGQVPERKRATLNDY